MADATEVSGDLESTLAAAFKEAGIDPEQAYQDALQPTKPSAPTPPAGDTTSSDPVAQPPAPPAHTQQPTEAEEEGLLDIIRKEYGYDLSQKYRSDREALHGLVHAYRMVGQREEDAQVGRLFKEHAGDFQEFLRYKKAPQAPQAPAQPPADAPRAPLAIPQYDPAWEYLIAKDDNGKLISADGDEQKVRDYRAYQKWSAARARQMVEDPEPLLAPIVEKRAAKIADEAVQRRVSEMEESRLAQDFVNQNSRWMFAGGNPANGQLTPHGEVFAHAFLHANQRMGLQTRDAVDYATNHLRGWVGQQLYYTAAQQPQAPAPPVAPPAPPAPPLTPGAAKLPNTAVPDPGPSSEWRDGDTLEGALIRNLKAAGYFNQNAF